MTRLLQRDDESRIAEEFLVVAEELVEEEGYTLTAVLPGMVLAMRSLCDATRGGEELLDEVVDLLAEPLE